MTKKERKKEWFLDRYCGQQYAALLEEGKLTEFSTETEPRLSSAGNIYKGRVVNVLSGMNAAFVDCGLGKNCYLSMEETYADCAKYDGATGEPVPAKMDLQVGDELIVQIVKPARGSKGAKITTHLSFVGKLIIYLPNTNFVGISRKITDEKDRDALLQSVEKLRAKQDEGFIFRTQAPFATGKQIKAEADYLKKLYKRMQEALKGAPVGGLLYEENDLPERVMRDCFGEEISAIRVGDKRLYERILKIAALRGDIPERKIHLHDGPRAMFREYGISEMIYESAQPLVPLEGGGSIVIEHTEAMTVIDVNTGSHVGDSSLEETVFAVNLTAAEEIARQVLLRNIGGIVVVDFIDMLEERHKQAVTSLLQACLAKDKAKCKVLPMSELCITQFTRKRVGGDMLSMMKKTCPHCGGSGLIPEDVYLVTNIRNAILDCFADGYQAAIIELNIHIMKKILQERMFAQELKERWANKRIYLIPHKTFREEYFTVRGDNASVLTLPDTAQILY